MRKWFCHEISNVKNPASRLRRAERAAELLLSTMEAELDLPPIFKLAFARAPRAYQGCQSITRIQPRNRLPTIFFHPTPATHHPRIPQTPQTPLPPLTTHPTTNPT